MRRVVVTGLGMVTPLACGVESTWERLLAGHSGAATIVRFDASHLATDYACEIPLGEEPGEFNPEEWLPQRERRKVDDFILYAIAAADQAVSDAKWRPERAAEQHRTGVMIGSGIGGLTTIANTADILRERGPRRISPFFIPGSLINLAAGQVVYLDRKRQLTADPTKKPRAPPRRARPVTHPPPAANRYVRYAARDR